ncbi:MAG: hypothetical protein K2X48_19320 [Chitinophagaceae bacterium]|nr:hypothetical protein [Chitinophagaceae bacterium]
MQAQTIKMGGFLKSSFFAAIIYCNFVFSICFMVVLASEGVQHIKPVETESVDQKPYPQSVSGQTASLVNTQ